MTNKEFIQTTQPIVDIIKAVVKIRHGEFSKHSNIIMTSVLDAQSKKDTKELFEFLYATCLDIDKIAYDIKKKLNNDQNK